MQLDVYPNPLIRARRFYPYVVVLQADIAALGQERIIAFLAPLSQIGTIPGRLMPIVDVGGRQFVVLMPSLTNVPVAELRRPVASLETFRDRISAALDWTFFGV